jgi:hypothetical protein
MSYAIEFHPKLVRLRLPDPLPEPIRPQGFIDERQSDQHWNQKAAFAQRGRDVRASLIALCGALVSLSSDAHQGLFDWDRLVVEIHGEASDQWVTVAELKPFTDLKRGKLTFIEKGSGRIIVSDVPRGGRVRMANVAAGVQTPVAYLSKGAFTLSF